MASVLIAIQNGIVNKFMKIEKQMKTCIIVNGV